jgi:type II secretory pathway component PulF
MAGGEDFAAALCNEAPPAFPDIWKWMIRTGAAKDDLAGAFHRLREYYRRKAAVHVTAWLGAMLPGLTVFAGFLVFFDCLYIVRRFIPLILAAAGGIS